MPNDRLAEIKARRGKITQGKWEIPPDEDEFLDGSVNCGDKNIALCNYFESTFENMSVTLEDQKNNADFIANSPTDIDWLIGEVERLRLKCGEASLEGVLISDYGDQAKCPHCGGYDPDYWDNPASAPEAEFPDFEVLVRCYECDGLYYAQRHEISFITSTKTKTEQENPARDITDAEIFQAISDFLPK